MLKNKKKEMKMKVLDLLHLTQDELYYFIKTRYEGSLFNTEHYMLFNYDETTKPMLCVHLDTINDSRGLIPHLDDFKVDGTIISLHKDSKLACVGGDDRCGVWIALQIMDDIISGRLPKNSYSIGFFCDEERGGKGSSEYILDLLDDEVNYTTAYIGLDRRNATIGVPEFATYCCDNKTLNNIVSTHYIEKMGSFTDASNIAEETNIACVNLSIGYNHEHTVNEYINTEDTEFTLEYLRCLPFGNEVYNYIKYPKSNWWDTYHNIDDKWSFKAENTKVLCQYCGEHLPLYDCCDEYGESVMLCETCKDFIY